MVHKSEKEKSHHSKLLVLRSSNHVKTERKKKSLRLTLAGLKSNIIKSSLLHCCQLHFPVDKIHVPLENTNI